MIRRARRRPVDTNTIKKILGYIDEHICEKISLSELAELAGYRHFRGTGIFGGQDSGVGSGKCFCRTRGRYFYHSVER